MNTNIEMSMERADELVSDMEEEYNKSLQSRAVSNRAVHFTHEVCERLRSVLDRLARLYWEKHISPLLADEDRPKATIYFPITADKNSFDSVMGRWRWKAIRSQHEALENYLEGLQPFTDKKNDWLRILNDLAVASKHIDLVPQKRISERRVSVSSPHGSTVSYGSGVTFGSGAYIFGAPVDPKTQRIVPTPGVTEREETWVSFLIDGYNVEPLAFCKEASREVRTIANFMHGRFAI